MEKNHSKSVIVVGVIGHIPPEFLSDFKELLENLSYFRLILLKDSNDKLWIVKQEGQ